MASARSIALGSSLRLASPEAAGRNSLRSIGWAQTRSQRNRSGILRDTRTVRTAVRRSVRADRIDLLGVPDDTSFEQRLLVFKAGSGAGFNILDIQADGSPSCVYGTDGLGAGHVVVNPDIPNDCDSAEDADYVVFESSRLRTPYVAVKVRPSLELNLEEEQLGFQLLRRLVDLQNEVETLAPGDPARAGKLRDLQQGESFLEYLIELQTAYGMSNFF